MLRVRNILGTFPIFCVVPPTRPYSATALHDLDTVAWVHMGGSSSLDLE
jgi:hypothetical protein